MKRFYAVFLYIGVVAILFSCAPVYKCGDVRPDGGIQGSSRLLEVVKERDELCDHLKIKEEENAYLLKKSQQLTFINDSIVAKNIQIQGQFDDLQATISDLKDKNEKLREEKLELAERYSTAITNNLNQGVLYDERIRDKERRVEAKEAELEVREAKIKELENKLNAKDSTAERMEYLLRKALLGFDADELTISIKENKVYVSMSDKLMFASGKTEVQTKGQRALQFLAEVLVKNKEFLIMVEGHTDNVPIKNDKFNDNWDLSVARATSIVRLLQDNGIEPVRMTASGKGEFAPRASNDSAEGKAKNRRTEIILYPAVKN
ncbi:MAG: OmpA family protein [Brumimicrobium sp.]|nr:OmpA family protein [Brumimicrobium sp.]MCO5268764.1 OmpA family protein [Brumimicrobium sp.]